jgi:hypothetical protein
MGAADWLTDIALHLGLGVATIKVDTQNISTAIYAITDRQIHVRTFIPLIVTHRLLYLLPITSKQMLIDEELATLLDRDDLMIQARQQLKFPDLEGVRTWHAFFHRVPSATSVDN